MAEWIVERRARARPLAHGHPPLRRRSTARPRTRHARIKETYETYYDIRYPNHEREAGRPLRVSPGLRLAPRARRRLRREVRLGAGQLVRVERGRRRRVAAPARLGRAALVAGDRRRAPRAPARPPALFDESSFAKLEIDGPGRRRVRSSASATTRSRASSGRSPTRRCSTGAAASSATSPSARLAEERFSIVTGTAFGNHDREWIRRHLPGKDRAGLGRAGPRRHLAVRLLRDLGPAGPRRSCSRSPRRTSATRPSPT